MLLQKNQAPTIAGSITHLRQRVELIHCPKTAAAALFVNNLRQEYTFVFVAGQSGWPVLEFLEFDGMDFRYLQPEDAEAAAKIHVEGQPGTVLTLMGHRFLVELYRAVSCSQWGEGIGAFDGDTLVAQTAMAVASAKFFATLPLFKKSDPQGGEPK